MRRVVPLIAVLMTGFFALTAAPENASAQTDVRALRGEYNLVAARIDSLVRAMATADEQSLETDRLPKKKDAVRLPEGTELVLIFWADDEARVWLNDYFVGETRLAPVQVAVPALYLRGTNRIRARCWDTDWVESGFLCGLYLRGASGDLHPVVVSDGSWRGAEGPADEITYAHSLPDIPGAEVIWGSKVFGTVDLEVTFESGALQKAAERATAGSSPRPPSAMRYHDFVQQMVVLETERERLLAQLETYSAASRAIPGYGGSGARSQALTLGKAGPLEERVSIEVSEQVLSWAEALPESQQSLVYPKRRALKGEESATSGIALESEPGAAPGGRVQAYQPPPERDRTDPGREDGRGGRSSGGSGEGEDEAGGGWLVGGGGGRAARLGLLVPTALLGVYVIYVLTHWKRLGENS